MIHGTAHSYNKKHCRCDACRAWKLEYGRKWREAHPDYQKNWLEEHPGYAKAWRDQDTKQDQRREHHYRWMQTIKAAQGCCLCKKKEGVLAHHHVDPSTKRYGVTQMYNMTLEAIIDEIDKCVVMCDSCHGRWHAEERGMAYATD